MHRRTKFIVLTSLLLLGLFAATYLVAKPLTEQPTVTLLYPKEPADSMLWPTNRSWVWSVKPPDTPKGNAFSIVIRMVHQPLKQGESPALRSQIISKAECDAELPTGKIVDTAKKTDPLIVAVQLINLNDIAVSSEKGRLRLLVQLKRVGGMVS